MPPSIAPMRVEPNQPIMLSEAVVEAQPTKSIADAVAPSAPFAEPEPSAFRAVRKIVRIVEDTFLVTPAGLERLTRGARELTIV